MLGSGRLAAGGVVPGQIELAVQAEADGIETRFTSEAYGYDASASGRRRGSTLVMKIGSAAL